MKSKNLKRLLAMLLVLVMTFSVMAMMTACSDGENDVSSDEDDENEKKTSYYVITESKTRYSDEEDWSTAVSFSYNDSGRLKTASSGEIALELKYNDDGYLTGLDYDYDEEEISEEPPVYSFTWEDGNLVKITMEQEASEYNSTQEFSYKDGKLVQYVRISGSNKMVATYDEHGNMLTQEYYDEDSGEVYYSTNYINTYEDGKLVKVQEESSWGNEVVEYSYDENGNLSQKTRYDEDGEVYSIVKFTYKKVELSENDYQVYCQILKCLFDL